MPESGIKINGKHYTVPQSLRVGETRQIKRITGLNPPEFMQAISNLNETQDPDVGAALVWWIVHREDPSFTVDDIDELEWGQIESEDGEAVEPADPKAEGAPSASSPTSAEPSNSTSEDPGETIPVNGGVPAWDLSGHPT